MTPRYINVSAFYARGLEDSCFDFSEDAMYQMFEAETFGVKHDLSNNGFAFGKKSMDITFAAWREELLAGNTTKDEILRQYDEDSFERAFVWEIIKDWPITPFFGFDRETISAYLNKRN